MDRKELSKLIAEGPVRITVNSGETFEVPNQEFAVVSDVAAYVLYRADDGKMRTAVLPPVTMNAIEPMEPSA